MKVLFLASFFPKPDNPVMGTWALTQAQALIRQGIELQVLSFTSWIPNVIAVTQGAKAYAACPQTYVWPGGVTAHYPRWLYYPIQPFKQWAYRNPHPYLQVAWWSAKQTLMQWIDEYQPDLIFCHHSLPNAWMVAQLPDSYQRPLIVLDHDFDEIADGQQKKQLYSQLIERRNLNRAAAIHCTAAGEASDVHAFGIQAPTVTLPLGVHRPKRLPNAKQMLCRQYNLSDETTILLFLSRVHYKKRPDLLLKSAAQLKAGGKDIYVILAGSGDDHYVAQLKQLAQDLGIGNHVSFPGFVHGHDKNVLLQGSDIFVLPSFSENFGIAIAESLAAGLPVVITSGIQIAPEIEAVRAGLVVSGNLASLTKAITKLIDMPQLASQVRENGLQLAQQHYSWQAIAKQLIPVYKEIQTNGQYAPSELLSFPSLPRATH